MNAKKCTLLAVLSLLFTGSAASAVQVGDFVFPKTMPGQLKVDQRIVGEVGLYQFLEVLQVRGNWLWVERREIESSEDPGPVGWIRLSEVDAFDRHIAILDGLIDEKYPNDHGLYYVLGQLSQLSNRPEHMKAAIAYFTRAIQLSPAEDMYYQRRGWCWIQLDHYENALADYEQAERLDPAFQPYKDRVALLRDAVREQQLERDPAPPAVAEDTPAAPGGSLDEAVSGLLEKAGGSKS